jgi:hypothetical protein
MPTDPRFLLQRKPKPGFPALQKAQQQLPRNPISNARRIACDLDGTLAQPRDLHGDIGNPLPGAVDFLRNCVDTGLQVFIVTGRPAGVVSHWIQRHAPGLQNVIHVCAIRPPVGVLLSAVAIHFDGTYPSCDELELTPWYQEEK